MQSPVVRIRSCRHRAQASMLTINVHYYDFIKNNKLGC